MAIPRQKLRQFYVQCHSPVGMSSITHIAVGLALSRFFSPGYLPVSIAFALLPDLVHVLSMKPWSLRIHGLKTSRTPAHGLLEATVYGTIGLLIVAVSHQIGTLFLTCVATHLFLDFISGVSVPFKHIKKKPIKMDFGNTPDKPLGRRSWIGHLQEASVIVGSLLIYMR